MFYSLVLAVCSGGICGAYPVGSFETTCNVKSLNNENEYTIIQPFIDGKDSVFKLKRQKWELKIRFAIKSVKKTPVLKVYTSRGWTNLGTFSYKLTQTDVGNNGIQFSLKEDFVFTTDSTNRETFQILCGSGDRIKKTYDVPERQFTCIDRVKNGIRSIKAPISLQLNEDKVIDFNEGKRTLKYVQNGLRLGIQVGIQVGEEETKEVAYGEYVWGKWQFDFAMIEYPNRQFYCTRYRPGDQLPDIPLTIECQGSRYNTNWQAFSINNGDPVEIGRSFNLYAQVVKHDNPEGYDLQLNVEPSQENKIKLLKVGSDQQTELALSRLLKYEVTHTGYYAPGYPGYYPGYPGYYPGYPYPGYGPGYGGGYYQWTETIICRNIERYNAQTEEIEHIQVTGNGRNLKTTAKKQAETPKFED
eukprot:NODE_127_length_17034_cov_0.369590.p1 type:complete len:415 gc:universal NODE_127_length_17034_cov_0.369590:16023-14779(-)